MMSSPSILFSPIQIRELRLKNRCVISPMMQHSAPSGLANAWHLVHLGKFALGGAALVLGECTAVSPVGRIGQNDLGLWEDAQIEGLAAISAFLHQQGSAAGIQLGHAGRKAGSLPLWQGGTPLSSTAMGAVDPHWERTGPSAIAAASGWTVPRALTEKEILEVIAAFKAAAIRADQADMDVVELHFGHGYLVASFLSPASNRRTDGWGGDAMGRMRLALRITEEVRSVWPSGKPLFCRLSCVDGTVDGWGMEDTVLLVKQLVALGVDVIDCSSGGLAEQGAALPVARGLGFQVPFARSVRQECGVITQAVGMIVDPHQAESILLEGSADLIALGREALYDPYWPLHAQVALEPDTEPDLKYSAWPEQHGVWLAKRHHAITEARASVVEHSLLNPYKA
jgi:2,4-dienoyl-CoA reductase-like NADH-dependent reductase (Old Yellow Enzyme family)